MGFRHTVGQQCAEWEKELTEERAGHARGACTARERSVRGTREERAGNARGACVGRERRRWSLVRTSGV
ncbi:unnamed protein product [Lampetra fluviatilis]